MKKPVLKQFADLSAKDFETHPVWVACHTVDHDESWFDPHDEDTFRPWTGTLPVDPADGMFLVRATMTCADGTPLGGFVTPADLDSGEDLGLIQPHVFVGDRPCGFWCGVVEVPAERKAAFYRALGKDAARVFPLQYAPLAELTAGVASGVLMGFYTRVMREIQVYR